MKKITILMAALLMLALTGCKQNTPEKVVDAFYKATQEQDFEKAMTYTNLDETERVYLATLLENMEMVIYDYEVLGSDIDEGDTTATVFMRLTTANNVATDSNTTELNVPCVKVDDEWKVTFF